MNEPSGKNTCGHSDNFTFEAVPDARNKENSVKKTGKIKLIAKIIFFVLCPASLPALLYIFILYLGLGQPAWWMNLNERLDPEEKIDFVPGPPYEGPHTMLFMGGDDPLKSSFAHPLLEAKNEGEKRFDNYRVMSVREGDILKVLVRSLDKYASSEENWHIYDPSRRNFANMPARYISVVDSRGVRFADGTEFYKISSRPPDAIRVGAPGWRYEMRWRRLWGEYYLVAYYRGSAGFFIEWLAREMDGKKISDALGESNLDDTWKNSNMTAHQSGPWIQVDALFQDAGAIMPPESMAKTKNGPLRRVSYTLVPVTLDEMEKLPPDFPRHLLRGWQ